MADINIERDDDGAITHISAGCNTPDCDNRFHVDPEYAETYDDAEDRLMDEVISSGWRWKFAEANDYFVCPEHSGGS